MYNIVAGLLFTAVEVMYTVRLLAETWNDDLAKPGTANRTAMENKIRKNVCN